MRRFAWIFLLIVTLFSFNGVVLAQTADDLQDELKVRNSEIESINKKITEYQAQLRELSARQSGLQKDIAIIENEVKIVELDIEALQLTIDAQRLQVQIIERQIRDATIQLKRQRDYLSKMLVELHRSPDTTPVQVVFSASGMHEALSSIEYIETMSARLDGQLRDTRSLRVDLQSRQEAQQKKVAELIDLESELVSRVAVLDQRKRSAAFLLAETSNSEAQYRVIMSELRQEQQGITSRILQLQDEISKRIREEDGAEAETGETTITSPLVSYVVTARFHDPRYPFRHLFQHSGLDMAAPSGTPIYAAAPGVVSWARTGSTGYGNYVMIIHDNGLATLYAHMTKFSVTQDQYVRRGQVIGYVGSTGFSTGPHLHFEVRLNGIPVDPQAYMQ